MHRRQDTHVQGNEVEDPNNSLFIVFTRVCSCNIFNRRAKRLVKVICTLT